MLFAAAAPGGQTHTADLRYSQLPAASPPRNAAQPWTASALATASGAAAGDAGYALPLSLGAQPALPPSPLSGRPSNGASRLGAPVR